ncbi:MAG: tRNA uridine-5-carboxymethylaminomethyl(34) synthesis GTPase MnmE [Blastocatellia bacterium]|jgi:tRNA modification GTPase
MLGEKSQTTIVAIATPPGRGAIGMLRMSGPQALSILLRRGRTPAGQIPELRPNRASLLLIYDTETDRLIDETLVTFFQGPHSFTGEDVVEISCHGSPVVLAELLAALCQEGALTAEPGEFSLRAFLNQRLDLAQAEAINDLINARTAYQARLAVRQVRGELSRQIRPHRQALIDLIVRFESAVEFVEDDLDPLDTGGITADIDRLIAQLDRLAASYSVGRIVQTGVKLALAGLPNVGKSSVFNALLGRDRAIVAPVPGTTRDTLNEQLLISGLPVEIVDTAGIRETSDQVETIGVERTRTAVADADLVVAILDASTNLPAAEIALLSELPVTIFVVNKCDLGPVLRRDQIDLIAAGRPVVEISALTGHGLGHLRDAIHDLIIAPGNAIDESSIITNERHHRLLLETLTSLRQARSDLAAGFTEEVALGNLHLALRSLGVITGETLIAEIINQIFSTFCIGK